MWRRTNRSWSVAPVYSAANPTFSTASYETVRLIEAHRYVAAAFNGLGMLAICTAAAAIGFAAALLVTR